MNKLQFPPLADGEIYVGAIGNKLGEVYHLVLMPGDNDQAKHQTQTKWAESIGGELPNKLEAAMLFAHFKDQFHPDWYWTNETSVDPNAPEDDTFSWVQNFHDGFQSFGRKRFFKFRARAVRRLFI